MDFNKVVREVPQLRRGVVWCLTCERSQDVDTADLLRRGGWPRCCGQTMSLDSPEERKALSQSRTVGSGE